MRRLGARPVKTVQNANPAAQCPIPASPFISRHTTFHGAVGWEKRCCRGRVARDSVAGGPRGTLPLKMCRSVISPWCGGFLLNHAGILKHVGPFPARSLVAVLEMLAEVIRPVKFLG